MAEPDSLEAAIEQVSKIKALYVDPRLAWYSSHANVPFFYFRAAGITTILLTQLCPLYHWPISNVRVLCWL